MDKQALTEMYLTFLRDLGYPCDVDEDGDVVFTEEDRTFIIYVDEDDDAYFRLAFPNFWPLESEDERMRAVEAALFVTASTKVAKVMLVDDNVWASVELFCAPLDSFMPVFERCMRALAVAVEGFRDHMLGEASPSGYDAEEGG